MRYATQSDRMCRKRLELFLAEDVPFYYTSKLSASAQEAEGEIGAVFENLKDGLGLLHRKPVTRRMHAFVHEADFGGGGCDAMITIVLHRTRQFVIDVEYVADEDGNYVWTQVPGWADGTLGMTPEMLSWWQKRFFSGAPHNAYVNLRAL